MLKSSVLAVVLVAGTAGVAFAETRANDPFASYDVSQFENQPIPVAVATDKTTGRKFNVVKMPSGKMMILMSADRLNGASPFADDSEMMYSGHRGTTR